MAKKVDISFITQCETGEDFTHDVLNNAGPLVICDVYSKNW